MTEVGAIGLSSVFDELGLGVATGDAAKQSLESGGIDLSSEDDQISAVLAHLSEETARLDRIRDRLRGQDVDVDDEAAGQVLLPQEVVDELKQTANAFVPAAQERHRSDESDSDSDLEPRAVIKNDAAGHDELVSSSGYPSMVGSCKPGMESGSLDWTRQHTALPPLLYSASLGKLSAEKGRQKGLVKNKSSSGTLASPALRIMPDAVCFDGCRVGSSTEKQVELRNMSSRGLRLSILPCTNRAFSNDPVKYDSATRRKLGLATGLVPPGVAVYLTVRFTPKALDDQEDQLVITSDLGNASLPVKARGVLPPSL